MTNPAAICGNCGQPFRTHYHENDVYCYSNTTGDTFTDEPSETDVLALIDPKIVAAAQEKWRKDNGHE